MQVLDLIYGENTQKNQEKGKGEKERVKRVGRKLMFGNKF